MLNSAGAQKLIIYAAYNYMNIHNGTNNAKCKLVTVLLTMRRSAARVSTHIHN